MIEAFAVFPHGLLLVIEFDDFFLTTDGEERMAVGQRLHVMSTRVRPCPEHGSSGPCHGNDFAHGSVVGDQDATGGGLCFQMLVKVRKGAAFGTFGVAATKAVTSPGYDFEFSGHSGINQAASDPERLLPRNVGVFAAVNGEGGCGSGTDPVYRTGGLVNAPVIVQVASEKHGEHDAGIDALLIGLCEVGRAVVVDNALHATRLVAVGAGALELREVGRQAEHQDEVTSSASSHRSHVIRIDVVFRGI